MQYHWENVAHQKWQPVHLGGGTWKIASEYSKTGRVMSVEGPNTENNTSIKLWRWEDAAQQKWRLLPVGHDEYLIVSEYKNGNRGSGFMTVNGPSHDNKAPFVQFSLRAHSNQIWKIQSV